MEKAARMKWVQFKRTNPGLTLYGNFFSKQVFLVRVGKWVISWIGIFCVLCTRGEKAEGRNLEKYTLGETLDYKRKPQLEWSWEAGRRNSHTLPFFCKCRPHRKGEVLAGGHNFTIPAGGRKISSSPGNSPANRRQLQLSQWETSILRLPNRLQWAFCL